MFEKKGAKKWLVLLVILVALSLVVDLLSLNVLYSISGGADLEGELASSAYYYYGCSRPSVSCDPRLYPCTCSCLENQADCLFDACKEEYTCKQGCRSIRNSFDRQTCVTFCGETKSEYEDECTNEVSRCVRTCGGK